jgi:hypothetical protein
MFNTILSSHYYYYYHHLYNHQNHYHFQYFLWWKFFLGSILIQTFHVLLSFPHSSFLRDFPTKIQHAFLVLPILPKCLVHHKLLDFAVIIVLGDLYKLQSFLLCNIHSCAFTVSFLGPNFFLSEVTFYPHSKRQVFLLFSHCLPFCFNTFILPTIKPSKLQHKS